MFTRFSESMPMNYARKILSLPGYQQNFQKCTTTQIKKLPNGLSVATETSKSPLACVALFISTGSRFENVCNNGISYFIEHMAYKGFSSTNDEAIQAQLNDIGAKMTSYTSREYQYFSGIGPAKKFKELICILSNIIKDLEFPENEIEPEKLKIYMQMLGNDSNQKKVTFDYLHQTAFQGTPLAQTAIGPSENLGNFNADIAKAFIKENYLPSRVVFAAAGDVNHDDVTMIAEDSFPGIEISECEVPLCLGPQRYTGSQIIYRDDSKPFLHVAIAVEAPGYNSPDYLPLFVASCLTDSWDMSQGGYQRHSSFLARAAATSELCVRFESFYIAYRDIGLWGVYFVSDMLNADDMMLNIQDQWMRLCTTLTNADVERAVNTARMKLAKNVNGIINTCYDIGKQVTLTCNRKSLETYNEELCALSRSVIKKVGHKYIYDKCPAVAVVGPSEVLSDYTRIRSGMYWLRL